MNHFINKSENQHAENQTVSQKTFRSCSREIGKKYKSKLLRLKLNVEGTHFS